MIPALFIDAWAWIILANQQEESFALVQDFYHQEIRTGIRLITSDFVLDEVITFLFAKAPSELAAKYLKELFSAIESNSIQLERIGADRFEKAWKMRLKYQNLPKASFTDFTSFVIMKDLSINRVLTNDRHFEQVNLGFMKLPQRSL